MSKKVVVVKLNLHDGREKQKAIKAVAAIIGIDSITVDMKSQQMTLVGMVDPVKVMSKLRKAGCPAAIVSVGPVKEPEKKEEKKEEKKKEEEEEKKEEKEEKKEGEGEKEEKKEEKEGEGEKKEEKKEEGEKEEKKEGDGEKAKPAPPPTTEQIIAELMNQYRAYGYHHPYPAPPPHPYMAPPPQYFVHSMEENPNSCVIC